LRKYTNIFQKLGKQTKEYLFSNFTYIFAIRKNEECILLETLQNSTLTYICMYVHTFSPHAILEALFEAAVLALVAVVLVNRTVLSAAALVRQVPSH